MKVLERTLSPKLNADEVAVEVLLRPKTLQEFIGQERVKENIKIFLDAAQGRGEALEHVLFCGPPGLGKTTLANIIAHEVGVKLTITSGPAVERVRDFATIVSRLGNRDILFIDEVHRLPRPVEEMLYPAMEDRCLDIIMGKGLKAHTLRLRLKPFTVIGATT
ncbi:MAG: AAA family ATPase, partial [Anaerolineae bacterium]|nr:AAA family ATPase [Anaerolineae bacterium]